MTQETWKPIPGYEDRYEASDLGRVRSVDRRVNTVDKLGRKRTRKLKGKVLAPGGCRGYQIVNLSGHGTVAVHLLVARTFLPKPPGAEDVNHRDGVKANNMLANLEWCTKSHNQRHAVTAGLKSQAIAVRAPSGVVYPSITLAAKAERVRASTAAKWERT